MTIDMRSAKPLGAKHRDRLAECGAPAHVMEMADSGVLMVAPAPMFASQREIFLARYVDIAPKIQPMDGAFFSGVMPWSLAIRMGTVGVPSHFGLLFREHQKVEGVRLLDTCEGIGCRNRSFRIEVKKNHGQRWYKGQWYWAPMADDFRASLNIDLATTTAYSFVGKKYGNLAICYEAMWHMPISRELAFLHFYKDIESENGWTDRVPYCSMYGSVVCQKAGRDPVPGRALQLTTPQDMWQSLAFPIKIQLVGEIKKCDKSTAY